MGLAWEVLFRDFWWGFNLLTSCSHFSPDRDVLLIFEQQLIKLSLKWPSAWVKFSFAKFSFHRRVLIKFWHGLSRDWAEGRGALTSQLNRATSRPDAKFWLCWASCARTLINLPGTDLGTFQAPPGKVPQFCLCWPSCAKFCTQLKIGLTESYLMCRWRFESKYFCSNVAATHRCQIEVS